MQSMVIWVILLLKIVTVTEYNAMIAFNESKAILLPEDNNSWKMWDGSTRYYVSSCENAEHEHWQMINWTRVPPSSQSNISWKDSSIPLSGAILLIALVSRKKHWMLHAQLRSHKTPGILDLALGGSLDLNVTEICRFSSLMSHYGLELNSCDPLERPLALITGGGRWEGETDNGQGSPGIRWAQAESSNTFRFKIWNILTDYWLLGVVWGNMREASSGATSGAEAVWRRNWRWTYVGIKVFLCKNLSLH